MAEAWPAVAFKVSLVRWLPLLAVVAAFTVVGAALAFGFLGDLERDWLVGWIILMPFSVIFGCGALRLVWAVTSGPIVTVGPRGVRDTRISPDWIPWAAITDFVAASAGGTNILALRIDPAFEATMSLTRFARWGWLDADLIGPQYYGISEAGLSGGFDALSRAIEDGWARARGG
jgi:hypothetical protein